MGFLDDLLGNTAADASKAAAADTYAKQQAASSQLQGQGANYASTMGGLGQNYASSMGNLAQGYQPWINTGQGANTAVQQLIANPSSVSSLPGYQFQLQQGTRALDHSAVANGNLFSGAQGKALQSYGQNLADTTYGNQLQRLLGVSQQGLGAQGQANQLTSQGLTGGLGAASQGLAGQLGANTSAYGGNMTSAGTIGQGNVAAANAQAQGSQNLLNMGMSAAGMLFGIPPVGLAGMKSPGASSPMNTLFGSSPQYGGGNFMNSAYGGSSSNPLEGLSAADYGAGF